MIKYKRRLNIIATDPPEPIRLGQYDTDVTLEFELYSSEGILTIQPDTKVAIKGIKPDGNGISVDGVLECNQDKRTKQITYLARIEATPQMTACAGECRYKLALTKDDKELNTCGFIVIVDRASLDKDILPSESEIREIVETIDRTDDLVKAAREVKKAKKEIEEISKDALSAKDEVLGVLKSVNEAKDTVGKLLGEIREQAVVIGDMLKVLESAKESALEEIGSAKGSAVEDVEKKKAELKSLAEDITEGIESKSKETLTVIESARNTTIEAIDAIQQNAEEGINSKVSDIMRMKTTAEDAVAKVNASVEDVRKSIDSLAQAHKDMKARVEHMEFEMFKSGGEKG